mmetsp:Transcript_3886/g.9129  ORF Transcript_3886/g.9129 Transcript_3886/m.9129 type:complete len:350 (-) Transcript_3886:526-1575(-)
MPADLSSAAGTKVQAKYSDGNFYNAEIIMISDSAKRAKAPAKVKFEGYDEAVWMSLADIKSKKLNLPPKENAASAPKAKAKAKSLKARVQEEISGRDIDEVIKEALAEVKACEAAIANAEMGDKTYDQRLADAKAVMEQASSEVEAAMAKETAALEKLKEAKKARGAVSTNTQQAESDIAECDKVMKILELELANRDKIKEFEERKREAAEAAEAARKALEESKLREKEAQEALKASLAAQRAEEAKALKDHADADKAGAEARKDKKVADKAIQKEMQAEIAAIEKARLQREKERQAKWRQACGIKGKPLKALTVGGEESPAKRPSLPTAEAPSAKSAKSSKGAIPDID